MLLRLSLGWHFFSEGTKKLSYNPASSEIRLNIPTEAIFGQAKGPLAPFFKSRVPGFHDWETLLAVPRKWPADDDAEATPPYQPWQERIAADWKEVQARFVKTPNLPQQQQAASAEVLEKHLKYLDAYLAGESNSIAEMQHQYWRLEQWKSQPEAEGLPYQAKRIDEKQAELKAEPMAYVAEVRSIQDSFYDELRSLVPPEMAGNVQTDAAFENSKQWQFDMMNKLVTGVIIGVGVCLFLGLFTRLASVAGCVFLLTVMATQPPWVAGASNPNFYYQVVELAALLVMIATSAGRFGGLDYFLSRCCGGKKI